MYDNCLSISRKLTPAQRRVLLAMHPTQPTDAWRVAWRLRTLHQLGAEALIAPGVQGFADARLTELGREVREALA